MLTTHPFDDDKLREECGIFGVCGGDTGAALVALGLHALQHRGQEAAGITSWDGREFHTHRAMGHVAGNFDRDEIIRALPGDTACGHVRYNRAAQCSAALCRSRVGWLCRRAQWEHFERHDAQA
jgi:amidophosphoribosyltransferase